MKYFFLLIMLCIPLLSGCSSKLPTPGSLIIKTGDSVSLSFDVGWWDLSHLFMTNTSGKVLSSSWNSFTAETFKSSFIVWDSSFFSSLVLGKKLGEQFEGVLRPSDLWYDQYYDSYRIQQVPLKALDMKWISPRVWWDYYSDGQGGIITSVDENSGFATVDFNALHTWQNIAYRVTVDSIDRPND